MLCSLRYTQVANELEIAWCRQVCVDQLWAGFQHIGRISAQNTGWIDLMDGQACRPGNQHIERLWRVRGEIMVHTFEYAYEHTTEHMN